MNKHLEKTFVKYKRLVTVTGCTVRGQLNMFVPVTVTGKIPYEQTSRKNL